MDRISQIRAALKQQGLQGEITEIQLLDVLRSLPSRPSLGAPAHADDSHDPGVELLTLSAEQRTALGLTVRTAPIRPFRSLRVAGDQQRQLQDLTPRLQVRVQVLACRNDNGLLSNGSTGQSQQELGEAISKTIAYTNEIFQGTNIELVFSPASDLEIRKFAMIPDSTRILLFLPRSRDSCRNSPPERV
jgi:hypothetical protein